jgi:enamine deaminase RidA (YjgF/YER057c/UK114 family)
MKRSLISSGSTFEAEIGYSRAVVQGDWIFVSGTTGFDYSTICLNPQLSKTAGSMGATTILTRGGTHLGYFFKLF